jgi:hypothetical protein
MLQLAFSYFYLFKKPFLNACNRRSKVDQERYFEDFPHPSLSVNNFTYVRRPLGLNNEAYELVRQEARSGLETRSEKRTRSKVPPLNV